jgi:predicted RecB family nuclease
MKDTISKSDWLSAEQCLTMAWFRLRAKADAPTEADLFRMQQGQEIGALARELYPGGLMVRRAEGEDPAQLTRTAIENPANVTLFEATFRSGPFIARADILDRHGGGWHVLEVKSRFSDTGSMAALVDDLAYTVMVARRSGLDVTKSSLLLLSRNYRYGDSPGHLFEAVDKSTEVDDRIVEFERVADKVATAILGKRPPRPRLVPACRDCPFFGEHCLGAGIRHSVLEIPGLHHKKLKVLSEAGIIDMAKLPEDFELNERQERARSSALAGRIIVEPGLKRALKAITWPCHYLDFETVATVLPLYDGHGCHRQVLTQFSIHHRKHIDAEPAHSEYLADASRECERELANGLIDKLGGHGAILVYSNFEKTRLSALRDSFPDMAARLQSIIDRLIDLLSLIDKHVYHPEFRGSFSIKRVLPVLVDGLSYEDLDVKDGDTAIARFAGMARRRIRSADVALTRQQLLAYCKQDTLAMVKLHEALIALSHGKARGASANPRT